MVIKCLTAHPVIQLTRNDWQAELLCPLGKGKCQLGTGHPHQLLQAIPYVLPAFSAPWDAFFEFALELLLCDRMVLLIDLWYSITRPILYLLETMLFLGMHSF
jgi:hypothetical protein